MRICKIHPSNNDCCCCIDDQLTTGKKIECSGCLANQPEHEILQIITTIFGKVYALVIVDGKIKKLPIDNIYDVQEVQPMIGGAGKYYGY